MLLLHRSALVLSGLNFFVGPAGKIIELSLKNCTEELANCSNSSKPLLDLGNYEPGSAGSSPQIGHFP